MSIDLAGSTAYKLKENPVVQGADPDWVKQIKHFYHDFPRNLRVRYREKTEMIDGTPYREAFPRMWKTVGDEIILCAKISDKRHLALCVAAFVLAVQDYGFALDHKKRLLDVKGSAWIGAFPVPNVTVKIDFKDEITEQDVSNSGRPTDNEVESSADVTPSEYDFIGKDIDGGFRISEYAAPDEFIVSAELAFFLSEYCHEQQNMFGFFYKGRRVLKGIDGDTPYPLFAIDVERNAHRRAMRTKERILTGQSRCDPLTVMEFILYFMEDRLIQLPRLKTTVNDPVEDSLPPDYIDYCKRWQQEAEETSKSIKIQVESETIATDTDEGSTAAATAYFEELATKNESDILPAGTSSEVLSRTSVLTDTRSSHPALDP